MSATATRETLETLVRERPLASPLVASIALFDYEYPPAEHLREIYGAVRRALSPEYPRAPTKLARLMPREHGKSETGTVVCPTWAALRDPDVRVLLMSETEDQAKGKLDECRDHLERLAPRFGRELEFSNATEIQLAREATYDVPTIKAAGFKTGVTGGHYDLLIFDDLVSWKMQRTPARREKVWQQFQDYLNLGSEGESVFLVLGTRKHRQDLYSHLIEGIGWDTRVERAIADWSIVENGEYRVLTRHQDTGAEQWYGADEVANIDGETETVVDVQVERAVDVLWPERWPIEALLDDLVSGYGREQSTIIWQRENQNDPSALEGEILSAAMLQYAASLPEAGLRWLAGLDLAVEDDPEAAAQGDTDYWALSVLAHHPSADQTYVVDVQRRRGLTLDEGIGWVQTVLQEVHHEYGADVGRVLAEDNQAQRWFVQTAQDRGLRVEPTTSTGDKEERIVDMAARFESGKVVLLEGGPADGWESFLQEWCGFPAAAHDDQLDATEIGLRGIGGGGISRSKHDLGEVF